MITKEKLYLKCRIVRRYFGMPMEAPDNNVPIAEYTTVEEASAVYEKRFIQGKAQGLHVQYAEPAADGGVYDWHDTDRGDTRMLNADIEALRWCRAYDLR